MTSKIAISVLLSALCVQSIHAQRAPRPIHEPRNPVAKVQKEKKPNCHEMEAQAKELEAQAKSLDQQARVVEQQRVTYIHEAEQIEKERIALAQERGRGAEEGMKQKEAQHEVLERQAHQAEEQRVSLIRQAEERTKEREALIRDRNATCGEHR